MTRTTRVCRQAAALLQTPSSPAHMPHVADGLSDRRHIIWSWWTVHSIDPTPSAAGITWYDAGLCKLCAIRVQLKGRVGLSLAVSALIVSMYCTHPLTLEPYHTPVWPRALEAEEAIGRGHRKTSSGFDSRLRMRSRRQPLTHTNILKELKKLKADSGTWTAALHQPLRRGDGTVTHESTKPATLFNFRLDASVLFSTMNCCSARWARLDWAEFARWHMTMPIMMAV
jgi:hypothetical protein